MRFFFVACGFGLTVAIINMVSPMLQSDSNSELNSASWIRPNVSYLTSQTVVANRSNDHSTRSRYAHVAGNVTDLSIFVAHPETESNQHQVDESASSVFDVSLETCFFENLPESSSH